MTIRKKQLPENTKSSFLDSFCEIMIVAKVKVMFCAFAAEKVRPVI